MHRLLALATFLVLLLVPAFAAQDQQPPKKFEDAMWRVANGLVKSADGKMVPLPPGETILQETEAALARELAQAEVTREFAAAAQRLAALRARATWHEVPRREVLLTNIAVARAKLLERTGDVMGALRALDEFYVREGEQLTDPIGLRPASFEEMRLRALALNTGSVRSLTEKLKKAADAPTDTDDAIATAVGGALAAGNANSIKDIGRRAVPALAKLASQGTQAWIDVEHDPLAHLTKLDEARAAQLILEHFDTGGPFWRRRAWRAMLQAQVLSNPGTYIYEPLVDSRPRLLETWWLPVVQRFLRDPESSTDSLWFVRQIAAHDALDDTLIAELARIVRGPDAGLAGGVQKILGDTRGNVGTMRIFESMLDATDPDLRAIAAQNLVNYKVSPGLRAAVRASDPVVRQAVAKSLQDRPVTVRPRLNSEGEATTGIPSEQFNPVLGRDDVALLEVLLRDQDPAVRLEAAKAARTQRPALPDATWLALTRDPSPEVRCEIASAANRSMELDLAARMMEVLAHDEDPQVLSAFDNVLAGYAQPQNPEPMNVGALLPAIEARFANDARPFKLASDYMSTFVSALISSKEGRNAIGRWALSGQTQWIDTLAGRIVVNLDNIAREPSAGDRVLERSKLGIPFDDAGFVRFLRAKEAASADTVLDKLARRASWVQIDHPEPWRALALDESASVRLRLSALSVLAGRADGELVRAFVEVVASPAWKAFDQNDWGYVVSYALRRMREEPARQALRGLLAKDGSKVLIGRAALGYSQVHAFTPELSDALLRRVLDGDLEGSVGEAPLAAFDEVASRPPAERGNWLERGARSRWFAYDVVPLLGSLRDPRYRPLLVECLDAPWFTDEAERNSIQVSAVQAIGRYLDDDAVQILLDQAGHTSNLDVRQACYDELNRIKSHLAAKEEWQLRRRAGASKDSAIAALLPMLDSKDATVRAQAARSLATLGAVEELPRLVRLLQDQDGSVREAAQRALEVLNSSTGTPR